MNSIARHNLIAVQIDILKSYIELIKHHGLEDSYRDEITYFREIIKGLIIDRHYPAELKAGKREIFSVLYKYNLQPAGFWPDRGMEYIEQLFVRLYSRDGVLRNNLFYLDSVSDTIGGIFRVVLGTSRDIQTIQSTIRDIDRTLKGDK